MKKNIIKLTSCLFTITPAVLMTNTLNNHHSNSMKNKKGVNNPAQDIVNKIQTTNYLLAYKTTPDVTHIQTANELRHVIMVTNPGITLGDTTYMSFVNKPYQHALITVKIGDSTATKEISYTINRQYVSLGTVVDDAQVKPGQNTWTVEYDFTDSFFVMAYQLKLNFGQLLFNKMYAYDAFSDNEDSFSSAFDYNLYLQKPGAKKAVIDGLNSANIIKQLVDIRQYPNREIYGHIIYNLNTNTFSVDYEVDT